MPEAEQKIIRHWLDAGANHAGTYAVNSHGTIGYYVHSVNVRNDKDWPETQAMVEVMNRRCDRCHAPTEAEKTDRHVQTSGTLLRPILPAGRIPEEQVPRAHDVRRRRPVQSPSDLQSVVPGIVESGSRAAGQRGRWAGRLSGQVRRHRFSRTRPTRTIWPSSLPSPVGGSIFWKRTTASA